MTQVLKLIRCWLEMHQATLRSCLLVVTDSAVWMNGSY